MAVRKLKPVTPGQRHKVIGTFEDITASVPEKSLVYGKRSTGGRNNTGKMTVRYMGGGHKRKFRFIDFKREKDGVPAVVRTIEYDPNRSARIALLYYADGEKRYIIAPNGLQVGAQLMSGAEAAPEVGNTLPLANIPVGTVIHNIELRPGQGALLVRSAGNCFSLLLVKAVIVLLSSLLAKHVRFFQLVKLLSVVLVILITHLNSLVRLDVHAGWDAVHTTEVLL